MRRDGGSGAGLSVRGGPGYGTLQPCTARKNRSRTVSPIRATLMLSLLKTCTSGASLVWRARMYSSPQGRYQLHVYYTRAFTCYHWYCWKRLALTLTHYFVYQCCNTDQTHKNYQNLSWVTGQPQWLPSAWQSLSLLFGAASPLLPRGERGRINWEYT